MYNNKVIWITSNDSTTENTIFTLHNKVIPCYGQISVPSNIMLASQIAVQNNMCSGYLIFIEE
jgi:hypothetical protein